MTVLMLLARCWPDLDGRDRRAGRSRIGLPVLAPAVSGPTAVLSPKPDYTLLTVALALRASASARPSRGAGSPPRCCPRCAARSVNDEKKAWPQSASNTTGRWRGHRGRRARSLVYSHCTHPGRQMNISRAQGLPGLYSTPSRPAGDPEEHRRLRGLRQAGAKNVGAAYTAFHDACNAALTCPPG